MGRCGLGQESCGVPRGWRGMARVQDGKGDQQETDRQNDEHYEFARMCHERHSYSLI